MNAEIKTVIEYARQWGVSYFVPTPLERAAMQQLQNDGVAYYSSGPGAYSIYDWAVQPVIYRDASARARTSWPYLLHELAHCCSAYAPEDSEELYQLTGFEILSILHLGLPLKDWERWQADFVINEGIGAVYAEEWRHAPPSWRKARLMESCDFAREEGLFVGGTPTFKIRRLHA